MTRKILIFGGTGSLGNVLVDRFLSLGDKVIVYSRDESKQWTLKNKKKKEVKNGQLSFVIGDIRDKDQIKRLNNDYDFYDCAIIASALKQIGVCEEFPLESIKTNILGIQNIVDNIHNFGTMLMVSTDKACNPANVYGMSKSIAERVVLEKSRHNLDNISQKFVAVRYGNVLESRGSIIPLFRYQAQYGDYLTLTHEEMTRFVMTLNDSVDLIVTALQDGHNGTTWIPKLPSMKILDLAEIFSEMYNKPIKITGIRPGEKIHESLISEEESRRTWTEGENFVIGPVFGKLINDKPFSYTSADDVLSKKDLKDHLTNLGIFDKSLEDFTGKEIEEIRT